MGIEISDQAARQIESIDAWWRANRPYAPRLFRLELADVLGRIGANPSLGTRFKPRPALRRWLVRRTRYHVYVAVSDERIDVIAVWSALRGPGPRL